MLKKTGKIHDTPTGYDFREDNKLRPMRAIRSYCLSCCRESQNEVKQCTCYGCTLWPYRMGKSGRKSNLTDEQKAARGERLRIAKNRD